MQQKLWNFRQIGSFEYLGDYDYYIEKKQELEELAQLKNKETKQSEVENKGKNHLLLKLIKMRKNVKDKFEERLRKLKRNMDTYNDLN